MNTNKLNNQKYLFIFYVIIFCLNFIFDFDKIIIGLKEIIPYLWILFYIYDIFEVLKLKYSKDKLLNELRINTINDNYYSAFYFIFGFFIFVVYAISFNSFDNVVTAILATLQGLAFLLKSFIFIPSALIRIENGNLFYENNNYKNSIELSKVSYINIKPEIIQFFFIDSKTIEIKQIKINDNKIVEFKRMLPENINLKIE